MRNSPTLLLVLVALLAVSPRVLAQETVASRAGAVISLIELAESEYVDAVRDGEVVNAAEFEEATEFTAEAVRRLSLLPDPTHPEAGQRAREAASRLIPAIDQKSDPAVFASLADMTVSSVVEAWGAVRLRFAEQRPSARRGGVLYRINCAECHGAAGRGDGAEGQDMDPPPADFTTPGRAVEASLRRDFEVMSFGVPATAMEGWQDRLSLQESWDLATYLQTLRHAPESVNVGRELALADGSPMTGLVPHWTDPAQAAAWTDSDMAARVAEATARLPEDAETGAIVAYLRTQAGEPLPRAIVSDDAAVTRQRLAEIDSMLGAAIDAAAAGDSERATEHAISAYMRFEGLEPQLAVRDAGVLASVERAFADFRADISTQAGLPDRTRLDAALAAAGRALAKERPSATSLAIQSFVIILREGFEAILIIGAIVAFLMKTGRAEERRNVYAGVGIAIAASLGVGVLLEAVFQAVPARREVLEGVTMLVAVAVLFSVSYWLVSKLQHGRWERYLKERMHLALGAGGGMALGGVAFLAVFREGVETVLFYKALNTIAGGLSIPVILGFVAGLAALAVIYLAFTRLGIRMPMRPFFAATSGILYLMATIFAGAGVAELQEAGVLAMTPLRGLPTIPGLGIHPTVETMAAQGLMLILMAGALFVAFAVPRLAASRAVAEARG